jgi:hypothetical protein
MRRPEGAGRSQGSAAEVVTPLRRDLVARTGLVTRIVEVAARVHIVNAGHYTPNMRGPPIIGPVLVETETQKQFGEMRRAILRRTTMVRPQM